MWSNGNFHTLFSPCICSHSGFSWSLYLLSRWALPCTAEGHRGWLVLLWPASWSPLPYGIPRTSSIPQLQAKAPGPVWTKPQAIWSLSDTSLSTISWLWCCVPCLREAAWNPLGRILPISHRAGKLLPCLYLLEQGLNHNWESFWTPCGPGMPPHVLALATQTAPLFAYIIFMEWAELPTNQLSM